MMTDKLFNGEFELSLRIIILLDEADESLDIDEIHAVDFIATYGKTFGLSSTDLNGENPYRFSEFTVRREVIQKALKRLVLDGLILPSNNMGIQYGLSESGQEYSKSLFSEYETYYRSVAKQAIEMTRVNGLQVVLDKIQRLSTEALRR